jgi:hypothetical protein
VLSRQGRQPCLCCGQLPEQFLSLVHLLSRAQVWLVTSVAPGPVTRPVALAGWRLGEWALGPAALTSGSRQPHQRCDFAASR